MNRLRLLKVIVQPIFAIDDGDTLTETSAEPVVVRPEDWPNYPTTQFLDALNELQVQLDVGAKRPPKPRVRTARKRNA
jgi:hypothetical protein